MAASPRLDDYRLLEQSADCMSASALSVPSIARANTASKGNEMSEQPIWSKLQPSTAKILSEDEVREYVAEAVESLGSVKVVARIADTTPSAVENWRKRRNTMSLTAAVRLCRQHPRFQSALARLIGIEADVLRAHETQRLLGELHRTAGDFIAELKERGR